MDMDGVFKAKVTIQSLIYLLERIKGKLLLNENRIRLFRNTVFGPWLDIPGHANDTHLLNFVLQHQVEINELSDDCPPIKYRIGESVLQFGRPEFLLITGLLFGELPPENKDDQSPFALRVFPEKKPKKCCG